jgi:chemotaxis protein MotB
MASVGYGEFQPVANNATAEGRARNRRVVLVVSRNLDVRRSLTGTGTANATPDAALRGLAHKLHRPASTVAGQCRQFSVTANR